MSSTAQREVVPYTNDEQYATLVTPTRILRTVADALKFNDYRGIVNLDSRPRLSEEEWTDIVFELQKELQYYHSAENPNVYHRFINGHMCPSRPINTEYIGLGRYIEKEYGKLVKLEKCDRCGHPD